MDVWKKLFASQFRYKPLADPENEIRLLRVRPSRTSRRLCYTLEHFTRSRAEEQGYIALSYCWGDPTDTESILVNNHLCTVTKNLWEALEAISQYHDTSARGFFWVDAICINQVDVAEKNEQVHKMWMTYSQADTVYAWLGPENADIQEELDLLRKPQSFDLPPSGDSGNQGRSPAFPTQRLHALMSSNYFSRTWIVPEFLQGRQLKLLCGQYSTDFEDLTLGGYFVPQVMTRRCNPSALDSSGIFSSASDFFPSEIGVVDIFIDILSAYAHSHCSDPRDRIFALLGDPAVRQLDDAGWMEPNYTIKPIELFLLVIAWCDHIVEAHKWPALTHKSWRISLDENANTLDHFYRDHLCTALDLPSDLRESEEMIHDQLRWTTDAEGKNVLILGKRRVLVEKSSPSMLQDLLI